MIEKTSIFTAYFFVLIYILNAEFTADFNRFLFEKYGVDIATNLNRADLGSGGSFGGKNVLYENLDNEAVVIVHGITNIADSFKFTADHFVARGYKRSELYATTWGDGPKTSPILVDMKCSYVKQIRNMIIAVRTYTGKKVDVIAYSMGSPIARKAILGGNCVDTGENLGPSLTFMVDTFIGVAGANFGSVLCFFPIPIGSCNTKTGLHCSSRFLNNINNVGWKYEGRYVYSISSTSDEKVGFWHCNRAVSSIPQQNFGIRKIGLNHDQVLRDTLEQQRTLVLGHSSRYMK